MPIRFWSLTKVGSLSLIRFIKRYWYWIVLLLFTIPIVYETIQTSVNTGNPAYPLIKLGLHLADADTILYETVEILKENPEEIIGMAKPDSGLWNMLNYSWHLFKNVIWKIFGLVWLITLPFVVIYKIVRTRQTSEPAKNFVKTIIYGGILVFVINVLVTLYYALQGSLLTYQFPEGSSLEFNTWILILTLMPFHGVINLISYLITLI